MAFIIDRFAVNDVCIYVFSYVCKAVKMPFKAYDLQNEDQRVCGLFRFSKLVHT